MKPISCVGLLLAMVIGSVLGGFVLTVLWGWFVVPVFNTPSLNIVAAIGLSLIVNFFTAQAQPTDEKKKDEIETVITLLIWAVGKPLTYLGLGWIVNLFM